MKRRWAALLALPLLAAIPWSGGASPTAADVEAEVARALARHDEEVKREFASAQENEQETGVVTLLLRGIPEGVTKETLFFYGTRLFQLPFRESLGRGGLVRPDGVRRVHRGVAGGLDATACEGCHSVGGRDGGGTFAQNALMLGDGVHAASAAPRNPPPLLGLGLQQALAAEMSAELAGEREEAGARARAERADVVVALRAKDVPFGTLIAHPDGSVDASGVRGVDADLVVRPFGWKGTQATLRAFVEEAARVHFGMQATEVEETGDEARVGAGPRSDPDGDGTIREIEDGLVVAGASYFAMLETPVVVPPADPAMQGRWARGEAAFGALGCASCHVPTLPLRDRIWLERSREPGVPPVALQLLADGEPPRGNDRVALYSDLRRHDLGEALTERADDPSGVGRSTFLTPPLWGVAETPPYLHDGRAVTLTDAILAHGGEAQAARDAFEASPDRVDVLVFLLSLSRAPHPRVVR